MVVCSNHAISGIKEENTVKRGRRQHIPSPLLLNSVPVCLMTYGCKVSYYSASLEVRKDLEYHFYSEGSSIKLLFSLTLPPHRLMHARLPCLSPSPRVCSNSSIESVISSNHLILCCHLLLLPSIFPRIRVFSNELALCIRGPKYWNFSISPCNEFPLELSGLMALLSTGLSRVFFSSTV